MIIDCIADLHGHFPKLEGGDLLIIAGDCTWNDSLHSWNEFWDWLDAQNYMKKVMVAGNHDNFCEDWSTDVDSTYESFLGKPCVSYLCDSGDEFEGLKIWGSPWTVEFKGMNPKCKAFTVKSDEELAKRWELIPKDIDILITHSPPLGYGDKIQSMDSGKIEYVGSKSLLDLFYKERIKPKLHVFGHVHEAYGEMKSMDCPHIKFINASHVNEHYWAVNKPIRVVL